MLTIPTIPTIAVGSAEFSTMPHSKAAPVGMYLSEISGYVWTIYNDLTSRHHWNEG